MEHEHEEEMMMKKPKKMMGNDGNSNHETKQGSELMLEAAQSLLDQIQNDPKFLDEVDHIQIVIAKAIKKKKHEEDEMQEEDFEDASDEGA